MIGGIRDAGLPGEEWGGGRVTEALGRAWRGTLVVPRWHSLVGIPVDTTASQIDHLHAPILPAPLRRVIGRERLARPIPRRPQALRSNVEASHEVRFNTLDPPLGEGLILLGIALAVRVAGELDAGGAMLRPAEHRAELVQLRVGVRRDRLGV